MTKAKDPVYEPEKEWKVPTGDKLTRDIAKYLKLQPRLVINRVTGEFKLSREAAWKCIAKAALGGLYESKGLYKKSMFKARERVLASFKKLAETGSTEESSATHKASYQLHEWLNPMGPLDERKRRHPSPEKTMADQPEVVAALTHAAVENIDAERKRQASLQSKRTALASKLYDIANELWDKVAVEARRGDGQEQAPEDDEKAITVRAPVLKSLAEAAHNALRDAQLVAGQATDRVEGFLAEISLMSNEQLMAFLMQTPAPRPLPERTDANVKVLDAEYEVSPDEPE